MEIAITKQGICIYDEDGSIVAHLNGSTKEGFRATFPKEIELTSEKLAVISNILYRFESMHTL